MHRQDGSTIDTRQANLKTPMGAPTAWPAQAELILSALEAGRHQAHSEQPRQCRRRPYRVLATLRLFSDPANAAGWTLYTRDVSPRSLGFVTQSRLPLGYGGRIELPSSDGLSSHIECTLLRCRQAAPGWYEGALYFNREQARFDEMPAIVDMTLAT